MTAAQLAEKSGLSVPTIYNIEAGKAQNPRPRTIRLLEKAVGKKFEAEFQKSLKEASTIEGLGEFQDFEPHDEKEWPEESGIYVFYDISDRPVYVGMGTSIATRIADHRDRFWFKRPIVERGAYVPIKDEKLRRQHVESGGAFRAFLMIFSVNSPLRRNKHRRTSKISLSVFLAKRFFKAT